MDEKNIENEQPIISNIENNNQNKDIKSENKPINTNTIPAILQPSLIDSLVFLLPYSIQPGTIFHISSPRRINKILPSILFTF